VLAACDRNGVTSASVLFYLNRLKNAHLVCLSMLCYRCVQEFHSDVTCVDASSMNDKDISSVLSLEKTIVKIIRSVSVSVSHPCAGHMH